MNWKPSYLAYDKRPKSQYYGASVYLKDYKEPLESIKSGLFQSLNSAKFAYQTILILTIHN